MARVTLIVNNFDEGSETFLHSLARQLVEIGHRVTVHVLLDGRTVMPAGGVFDTNVVVRSAALPAVRSPRFVLAAARLLRDEPAAVLTAVRRAIRLFGPGKRAGHAMAVAAPLLATRPQVVHVAFSGIGVAIDDGLLLLDRDTRLIVSCRGTGELVAPTLDPSIIEPLARLLRRVDAVHAVAETIADAVRGLGVSERRIHLIRPAVDVDALDGVVASADRMERRRGRARIEVVSVGRLHWIKAVEVQVAAAVGLAEAGVPFHWTVVGDGPERKQLEVRARLAGVGSSMTFLGAVPPARVREIVAASDVFVSSSLSEGTSNAVLEAMALGVPVVCSAAGGMPEVLSDGIDALVVPVADPNSVVAAVARIAGKPELAARLSSGGVDTVRDRFTIDRQRSEWSALYAEVLDADGHPR